jgi:hypothetical protein
LSKEGTSDESNILHEDKFLILNAFLGKGKTTAIKRLIQIKDYKKILCLSPRQAFARFLASDFNIDSYLDENSFNSNQLVISVESLYKINSDIGYELIVIDESESILNQFSSTTMNANYLECFNTLLKVIQKSKKVIFADAFISNRTLYFSKHFNEKITMIKNNTKPTVRTAIQVEKSNFNNYLLDDLKKDCKNYICFSSKKELTDLENILKCDKHLGLKDGFYKNALLYYGKGDDKVFKDTLDNINKSWVHASIVITSPSITVGNSFSVKDHFNKVYINASPTCTVRDTFQTHMRVRYLKDDTLIFSLPTTKQCNFIKTKTQLYFDVIEMFENFQDTKKEMITKLIDDITNTSPTEKNDTLLSLKAKIQNSQETPKALKDIFFFNLLETSISSMYYNNLFYKYLEICGYNVIALAETNKTMEFLETIEKFIIPYDDIEKLDEYEVSYIEGLEKRKEATKEQKLQKDKYFFELLVKEEYQNDKYFYDYYMDSSNRKIFDNARVEAVSTVENLLIRDYNKSGGLIEKNDMKAIQLKYIQEINKALNLEHSFMNKNVELDKIKGVSGYLTNHRENIHDVFGMRDKTKANVDNLDSIMKFLNKIYRNWNNTEFQSVRANPKSKNKSNNLIVSYNKKGNNELFNIFKSKRVKTN